MNDAVIIYRSYAIAISRLPIEDAKDVLYAVMNYGLNGAEPDLSDMPQMVFEVLRPFIDLNNSKRAAGSKGGRPKKEVIKEVIKEVKSKNRTEQNKEEQHTQNAHEPERVISSGLDMPNPEPQPISDKAKSFAEWFIKSHDPRPQVETTAKAIRHIKSYEELIDLGYSNGDIVRAIAYSMGGECYYQNRPRTFKVHPIWSKAVRSPAHLLEADATGTRKLDRVLAALAAEDKNDIPNSDWAY